MKNRCPPDDELERLLVDQLGHAEEEALEAHVAKCEACQNRLEELTTFSQFVQPSCVSNNGADRAELIPGSVLARLANSSKPLLQFVKHDSSDENPANKSTVRNLSGSSAIINSGEYLRRQIWTWPLIAAVLLGAIGWWVHESLESAMRRQRINELNTVLAADIAAVRNWIDSQRATAELLAADNALCPLIQELLAISNSSPKARSQLDLADTQTAVRSHLAERLQKSRFTGFIVTAPDGMILAIDTDAPIGTKLNGYRQDFFSQVTAGRAKVSKPFLSPMLLRDDQGELNTGQPCMYAAAPIRDENGRSIAAVGFRLRPDDEFSQILRIARSGTTGETYAFDKSGLLLSQSRFDDQLKQIGLLPDRPNSHSILGVDLRDPGVNMVAGNRPVTRRTSQPLTRMATAAVQGKSGIDADGYRDYRGVPVVGAWRWLDDLDLGIATEIDSEEAFAPVYVLRNVFGVLMLLLIFAAAGIYLATLIIARQTQKLHDATVAAQQFGQYTLEKVLGKGGMGTVYQARHALLRRPTAVKLLNAESMSDTSIDRFEREVQLTSGLSHPNTVAIYDYGRTPEGVVYYAMEYLEGVNLDELVNRYGPLSEGRTLYILFQICASLAEAHAANLIHRDVKPANVLLTIRGGEYDFVKLLDFGLAKSLVASNEPSLSSTDMIAGTPLYVSPEAVTEPEKIDPRSDVYAIGGVGYFLLTGVPVFVGSSVMDICLLHVSAAPQLPSARLGKPLSPDLETLIMRCLAKSPTDRPKNAADLLRQLKKCRVPENWTSDDAATWWNERDPVHCDSAPQSLVEQNAFGEESPAFQLGK